jgi:hypothetical protein
VNVTPFNAASRYHATPAISAKVLFRLDLLIRIDKTAIA